MKYENKSGYMYCIASFMKIFSRNVVCVAKRGHRQAVVINIVEKDFIFPVVLKRNIFFNFLDSLGTGSFSLFLVIT